MSAPTVKWISTELANLLGFEATDDVAKYILSIEHCKDLEEYLCDLLDVSVPRNRRFIDELLRRWNSHGAPEAPQSLQLYKKADVVDSYITGAEKQNKTKKKWKKTDGDLNAGSTKDEPSSLSPRNAAPSVKPKTVSPGDKKTKFVPLFNDAGEARKVAILPGRHGCDCQAAKHKLINNCLQCGRVVCEQEGSGPCIFCGTLVCTREEQEVLNRGSKKSEKLRQQLLGHGRELLPKEAMAMKQGQTKAVEHKNRLLEYDRTAAKRTQVIDDESDYFATESNQWLGKGEREALQKREEELRSLRHASRKDRKITLDFAGRRVIEEDNVVDMYSRQDAVVQKVHYGKDAQKENEVPQFTDEDFESLVNPKILQEPPQFVESNTQKRKKRQPYSNSDTQGHISRLQDGELQQMSDEGLCLSMHQPWASLLVQGIKLHEGRTWYSAHRGRLWIASTAQKPESQEIEDLQETYKRLYDTPDQAFPKDYPVGCLLGCVHVDDVLDQDTYRQKYPLGESASPYVFVCSNPQQLIVKFPMKGKHKIYKLDNHIHQGAKKGLRHS